MSKIYHGNKKLSKTIINEVIECCLGNQKPKRKNIKTITHQKLYCLGHTGLSQNIYKEVNGKVMALLVGSGLQGQPRQGFLRQSV